MPAFFSTWEGDARQPDATREALAAGSARRIAGYADRTRIAERAAKANTTNDTA
jgi:hypothetical protein